MRVCYGVWWVMVVRGVGAQQMGGFAGFKEPEAQRVMGVDNDCTLVPEEHAGCASIMGFGEWV
jgi:hypothetical protein